MHIHSLESLGNLVHLFVPAYEKKTTYIGKIIS